MLQHHTGSWRSVTRASPQKAGAKMLTECLHLEESLHGIRAMGLSPGTVATDMQRVIKDQLTDRQRTALLAELKGMPQDEIARHLGSNRNAVYKLTHDARKKLKHGLEAAGYTAEDIVAAIAK